MKRDMSHQRREVFIRDHAWTTIGIREYILEFFLDTYRNYVTLVVQSLDNDFYEIELTLENKRIIDGTETKWRLATFLCVKMKLLFVQNYYLSWIMLVWDFPT